MDDDNKWEMDFIVSKKCYEMENNGAINMVLSQESHLWIWFFILSLSPF